MITESALADRCLGTGEWTGLSLLGLTRYFDIQRPLVYRESYVLKIIQHETENKDCQVF